MRTTSLVPRLSTLLRILLLAVLAGMVAGCGAPPADDSPALRLVDLFDSATSTGAPAATEVEPVEWRFDGDGVPSGGSRGEDTVLQADLDVAGAEVREGRLVGRSTSDVPLFHLAREQAVEGNDVLHAVEVRARISAGSNLELFFSSDDEVDLRRFSGMARGAPRNNSTPIVEGDDVTTYVVTPDRPVAAAQTRHVILRPTDVADADFEVESVRLVFRRAHLASLPAGIGWHGLAGIYRETLVTRAPEKMSFALTLPARPRFDLALGTLEELPVTFAVNLRDKGSSHQVLRRTVTRPDRWDEVRLDLAEWAGRPVELELTLETAGSHSSAAIGFWGSPVVRGLHATNGRAANSSPTNGSSTHGKPRGILVIAVDTLRADHLDLYGYERETAPALSRFAQGGAAFENCVVQGTWTKVSFSSILSGLHPLTHGVTEFNDRLPASATTLAEVFRDAGYATLSLSSISFNGKFTNLHQGFEVLHESESLPRDPSSKTAVHYTDRLLPWLEAHRDVPFFALYHVSDPHSPYRPYEPYDRMWTTPERAAEFEQEVEKVVPVIKNPLMQRFKMPRSEELESVGVDPDAYASHERAWYDGSIRAMDAEIGRLLERLDELGLTDEILIAFTADHGTEFLEHDDHWHGHTVYGELTRVPLVLRGPGVPSAAVYSDTVQSIDLMPTLLDLAGLAAPEGLQGRSLAPLLRDESWRPLPAFTYKARLEGRMGPPNGGVEALAMTADEWKLVHYPGSNGSNGSTDRYELYAHREDPLNLMDVAAANADVVEQMAVELASWRQQAEAAQLEDAAVLDSMSAGELERLRALGYVD